VTRSSPASSGHGDGERRPEPLTLPLLILLGGLIALSATAVDITLVALPATTRAVGGDVDRSGLIVTAYLAGFAPGQLLWGFIGDRLGRRRAVMAGLIGFIAASAACALASTFEALLVARLAQGLAGGSGPVLSRAIVRDLASELSAAKLLALLTAVLGAAPLLAPPLGAALLTFIDWRSIFWLTAVYAGVILVMAASRLPESLPADSRSTSGSLGERTSALLRNRDFRLGAALVALPFGGYHTLLALYPGVVIVEFGRGEAQFTWLLAGAAACFVAGSTISRLLVMRMGLTALMRTGAALCVCGAASAAMIAAGGGLPWVAVGASLYMLGMGQMFPLATAIALRHARGSAAWAAALLGLLQIGGGALLSYVATVAAPARLSLPTTLLICSCAAVAVLYFSRRGTHSQPTGARPS